ncbi:MAG: hypothetical protein ABIW47_03060 [Ginsengibacter sp.]|jgi:hypothetical protein
MTVITIASRLGIYALAGRFRKLYVCGRSWLMFNKHQSKYPNPLKITIPFIQEKNFEI